MNNLFKNIFNLLSNSTRVQKEDYLTEIFAFCLSSYPQILFDFLRNLKIEVNEHSMFRIRTQESFKSLEFHSIDSKPDITIWFEDQIIFIECKVDAKEGQDQLKRYAEHLDNYSLKGTLIYLTRDFDPKDENEILEKCTEKVGFKSFRWHNVHHLLKKYKNEIFIKQMLMYMESIKIATVNRFSPIDIIALSNFSRVKRMIDETFSGEIIQKFETIGKGRNRDSASMTQLRDYDRYIYFSYQNNDSWIGLGYWMNSFNEEVEYPDIRFIIEVAPKSKKYQEIRDIMDRISKDYPEWQKYNFERLESYAGIAISKSMRDIMSEENHIESIRKFFLDSMDNYGKIMEEFNGII